jgi:hypothetical protein
MSSISGSVLIEGIEGVTRFFVDPMVVGVLNFKKWFVLM